MKIEEIVLSTDQALHLQELGMDMTDAALWHVRLSPANEWHTIIGTENCLKLYNNPDYRSCYCPTYSFDEIINKLPKKIEVGPNYSRYSLTVDYDRGYIAYHGCGFLLKVPFDGNRLRAAYTMLRRLFTQGYIEEGKK